MHIRNLDTVNGLVRADQHLRAERDRLLESLALGAASARHVTFVASSPQSGNVAMTIYAPTSLHEFVQAGLPAASGAFGSEAWGEFTDEILAVCKRRLDGQIEEIAERLAALGVVVKDDAGKPRSASDQDQDPDHASDTADAASGRPAGDEPAAGDGPPTG